MRHILITLFLFATGLFIFCQSNQSVTEEAPLYANLHDTVKYVGMNTCKGCHAEIYETFMRTGMGESFGHATSARSDANFEKHTLIYDSLSNFYYRPFLKNDTLHIEEFRLSEEGDTLHQQIQKVDYIVGSGHHTNSHIFEENGYLYQAPITFYTQQGFWDLAPGFEGGFNSRFNRIIGMECMSCHNSLPDFVNGSENKYHSVPQGISCERCHGPGEAHVKAIQAGLRVDTATQVDYNIVNPRKLPTRELTMSVCQRCHLQGVAILKEGKGFDDFRPAMHLKEVMDVFLPEFDGNQTKFIMASQAHRMTMSKCYQASEMTCLTCHNPHVSVRETPRQVFNNKCINCHQEEQAKQVACTVLEAERIKANKNDCSGCHMPESESIDIPHVTVTDHYIRRPISEADKDKIENFIGLVNVTGGIVDDLTLAKGYLHYYESYSPQKKLLDSALYYLERSTEKNSIKKLPPYVHVYYLQQNFDALIDKAKEVHITQVKDGWTAYRIGEAYLDRQHFDNARIYFKRALQDLPLNIDFRTKLGIAQLQVGKVDEAQQSFEEALREAPLHLSALTNLGFVHVKKGNLVAAKKCYETALARDPDYVGALLNMAGLHLLRREKTAARRLLKRVQELEPANVRVGEMLKELKKAI